jgi:hypothetical protein
MSRCTGFSRVLVPMPEQAPRIQITFAVFWG